MSSVRPSRRALGLVLALVPLLAPAAEPPLQELALHAGADQGVFAEAEDGTVLVAQSADHAVHPASVTKIATSLALLDRLGPAYRFETRVLGTRPLRDGTLDGDLVVEAGRDPFLVFEGAFMILRRLHALGLRTVDGRLVVHGPLLFNWQPDADGRRLVRALAGKEGTEAWAAVASSRADGGPASLRQAALVFRDHRSARPAAPAETLLVYGSPPLLTVVKALNGYSNNVFHLAADQIGGAAAVEAIARASVPAALAPEIAIDNAAGAGTTNRMSPRVAAALLRALGRQVARHGHALSDVLPVSGVDPGTLEDRLLQPPAGRAMIVGKTGTFGSVGASALAGVLRTRRHGAVVFAVLNHGLPVPEARRRQDAFVRALIVATDAEPWPYDTPARPAFASAEVR